MEALVRTMLAFVPEILPAFNAKLTVENFKQTFFKLDILIL